MVASCGCGPCIPEGQDGSLLNGGTMGMSWHVSACARHQDTWVNAISLVGQSHVINTKGSGCGALLGSLCYGTKVHVIKLRSQVALHGFDSTKVSGKGMEVHSLLCSWIVVHLCFCLREGLMMAGLDV